MCYIEPLPGGLLSPGKNKMYDDKNSSFFCKCALPCLRCLPALQGHHSYDLMRELQLGLLFSIAQGGLVSLLPLGGQGAAAGVGGGGRMTRREGPTPGLCSLKQSVEGRRRGLLLPPPPPGQGCLGGRASHRAPHPMLPPAALG